MKKVLIIAILLLVALVSQGQDKIAVYMTATTLPNSLVEGLSKSQLLIVDCENLINDPGNLKRIKEINPDIKLIAYVNPMETWGRLGPDRSLAAIWKQEIKKSWYLRDKDARNVVFYPGMLMMNITDSSYIDAYYNWLSSYVLNYPIWDGIFLDNGTSTISWLNKNIDANNDGRADSAKILDHNWKKGYTRLIKEIREKKGNDFIIITNKGETGFSHITQGQMFENFPNDYLSDDKRAHGWYQCIANAMQMGPYTIFQGRYNDWKFVWASSKMLDNVYVAIGQNMLPPDSMPKTGKAMGTAYYETSDSSWRRNFQNLNIVICPEKGKVKIIRK